MIETVAEVSVPAHGMSPNRLWWQSHREQVALAALLTATAVAYFWNLTVNGWANKFYAAAVQAGTVSWKSFFFGSMDPGNVVTVDKTPLAFWPMELSARIFGLSSASMLAPQVLLGVGSVALLWATVRRPFGPTAGLLAGAALALTPVAALMFRHNNPDAMLTFMTVAAGWAMTRALADGRWRWLVATGAFIGLGFLAKQLQVMLVVPGLALAYLLAGPPRLAVRIGQLCAAGVALIVGAGWWVLVAQLWPTDSRPYFGGSRNNSILDLTVGYNGIERLDADRHGPRAAVPGIGRLFTAGLAGQTSWLIPAALVLLVVGLILRAKVSREIRGALVLWGGWMIGAGLVFSFMSGTFHEYYTLTMSPAVAALIGGGSVLAWRERDRRWVRAALALSLASTTVLAWSVLSRTPDFVPWLRWAVAAVGVVTTMALLLHTRGKAAVTVVTVALCVGSAGPVAYAANTLASAHTGGGVVAGPRIPGRGGWGMPPERGDRSDGARRGGWNSEPSKRIVALLRTNAKAYDWAGAAIGSHTANAYQLASGQPVISIGGFMGRDPAPTLAKFQEYVAQGRIHYFIGAEDRDGFRRGPGGGRRGRLENTEGAKITAWVKQHFTAIPVDGVPLYDLTAKPR